MKPELGDCAVYSMQKVKVEDLADFPTHQVDEKYVKRTQLRKLFLVRWIFNLELFDMHEFII